MTGPAALELRAITKQFGRVAALQNVSLRVRPGTLHAVLGENGAGKTTLMHVAYGMIRPDSGDVMVHDVQYTFDSPAGAIAAGLGMVHQHFTLVPTMSVAENLALGGKGIYSRRRHEQLVREIAQRTAFALDANELVESLSVGAQQRVEIAKALAGGAKLLILDEPTAVLAPSEADELMRWLRAYVDAGSAAILITHKLREALSVADDVTVLRRGRVTLSSSTGECTHDDVVHAMIGEKMPVTSAPAMLSSSQDFNAETPVVFEATDLSLARSDGSLGIRNATFRLHAGEIIGVAAVEGAGQELLLRALAGRVPLQSGRLTLPSRAGFVPEDRHRDAVLLERPIVETMALRGADVRTGIVAWHAMRSMTQETMAAYDVRAESPDVDVSVLSGGNQQKLVLGRELSAFGDQPAPTAIVVENPTRGLDIRAASHVHARLRDASRNGACVVIYSSDLDEVLSLAERVLVVFNGEVAEVGLDREAIGRAMVGS